MPVTSLGRKRWNGTVLVRCSLQRRRRSLNSLSKNHFLLATRDFTWAGKFTLVTLHSWPYACHWLQTAVCSDNIAPAVLASVLPCMKMFGGNQEAILF